MIKHRYLLTIHRIAMSVLFFIGIYIIIHLIVASIRAFSRAKKFRYYYLSRGVMPFPRSLARRILHAQTFLYAIVITGLLILLAIITNLEPVYEGP